MTHKPTCILFVCTCETRQALDLAKTLLETEEDLFEDHHITPDDIQFLKDMQDKDDV